MALTRLSALIESVLNPNGRFQTLEGIYGLRDTDGEPLMAVTEYTADFVTVYQGEEYILKCPLTECAAMESRWADISVYTQRIDCPHIVPSVFMTKEMLIFDSADNPVYSDIILQKRPDGNRLDQWMAEAAERSDTTAMMRVCAGLADMARWLAANDFSHGNISAKNVYVTPSLIPVMVNYTHGSRNRNAEDVRNTGALALALYVAACRPEIYSHIIRDKILRSGSLRKFSLIIGDIMSAENATELQELLAMLASENPVNSSVLCTAIDRLSHAEPGAFESLNHISSLVKGSRQSASKETSRRKYPFIGEMCNMLMRVFDGKSWFYLDKNGDPAIAGPFLSAGDFAEGRAVVETADGFGMIGLDGGFILEPIYDDIEWDSINNVAIVSLEGYSGLYSRNGESVTGLIYDQILSGSEGLFPVKFDGVYGYIRKDGTMAIRPQYDNAFGFRDGVAKVVHRNRELLIDTAGKPVADIPSPVTPYAEVR